MSGTEREEDGDEEDEGDLEGTSASGRGGFLRGEGVLVVPAVIVHWRVSFSLPFRGVSVCCVGCVWGEGVCGRVLLVCL